MTTATATIQQQIDFFETYDEALAAARRIRDQGRSEGGMIARVVCSPYNGYSVVSIPAEVYADLVSEGIPFPGIGGIWDKGKA